MKSIKVLFLIIFGSLLITSCGEDDKEDVVILPSNLNVELTIDTTYDGTVNVVATASNTNYYSFLVNDKDKSVSEENSSGLLTYQFAENGNYSIRIRAHSTESEFIEDLKSFEIILGGSSGGGNSDTSNAGYTTPLTYPNYTLVWNDEFDGTSLNEGDWNFEIGTGNNGWGNNELQYYKRENVSVENGRLIITAKNEFFNNNNYTSSRVTTQGKKSFKYGRIDIRARMPEGQGLWPALWMLGDNINSVSWPACGEIDIMEMVGGTTTNSRGDGVTHGTIHWSDASGSHANYGQGKRLGPGKKLSDEFNVYSIVWNSSGITWYFNDQQFNSINTSPAALSEFNQNFFFIMNVAVGGNWPGSPDNSTQFPDKMQVDYVRVFQ